LRNSAKTFKPASLSSEQRSLDQQKQYQSQIAEQQRQIKGLSAALQKLDAKMEMRSAALRTAANGR
jgi:hypothetical protein